MKTTVINTFCVVLVMLFTSCNSNKKKEDPMVEDIQSEPIGDNSMTSLDWEGTYEGLLPCADCEGIKTVVSINKDNTYVSKETYVGKDTTPFESKGTFKWDKQGQKITFSDKNGKSYFVGENTLIHLDREGNKISGDLAEKYKLMKIKDQLAGKKWHLVSFRGEEIQPKEAKTERPHIEFSEDLTLIGYTGCNNLRGGYTLEDGLKIKFSKLISTKKFCPEMETENEFLKTLNVAASYAFEDHALVMYDSEHQRLAQFKVAN